ncbi:hypothetical protein EJ04DRAFT_557404 [Polyplosphaeria fusca]|uniref:Uncharacterized protein n=1 Tax=Polyplosphaeria fusca TaxID=682080 RepID=A0A9P4QJG0_9PLEO|nr:hypothetical protein EJ04DRAFT_557404 [Polyplosphaeria fusca]
MAKNNKSKRAGKAKHKNPQTFVPPVENVRVHISGLKGVHPLEVGIAYYFRGHYVYSLLGCPIEPTTFCSDHGKPHISGVLQPTAPDFDPASPTLVEESKIAALAKTMHNISTYGCGFLTEDPEDDEEDAEKTPVNDSELLHYASEDEDELTPKRPGPGTLLLPLQGQTAEERDLPFTSSYESLSDLVADSEPLGGLYSPHDRAQFLAASAPGSVHNSRPSSPNGDLRPSASSSRLLQLADQSAGPMDHRISETFNYTSWPMNAVNLAPSLTGSAPARITSGTHPSSSSFGTRSTSPASFVMTDYPARTLRPSNLNLTAYTAAASPSTSTLSPLPLTFTATNSINRHSVIGTGRPAPKSPVGRPRKASIALNKAWNENVPSTSPPKPPMLDVPTANTPILKGELGEVEMLMPTKPAMLDAVPGLDAPGLESEMGSAETSTTPTSDDGNKKKKNKRGKRKKAAVVPPPLLQIPTITPSPREAESPTPTPPRASNPNSKGKKKSGVAPPKITISADGQTRVLKKCALHGEECDGETVTNLHLTEATRRGIGFKEAYPVIEKKGRVMVDWEDLVRQEREWVRLGMGGGAGGAGDA